VSRLGGLAFVAGAAAYVAPVLLLASEVALITFRSDPGLMLQRSAMALFVPAIAGVLLFVHDRARWQMGAGAAIAVLFPLGLLILSSAMIGSQVSRRVAALLAAGALLFPLAHLGGVPAALLAVDVILLVAFWRLAPHMMNP